MLLVASIVESVVPLFPLITDGRLFREMNFFGGLTQGLISIANSKKWTGEGDFSPSKFLNVKTFELYDGDNNEKTLQTYIPLQSFLSFELTRKRAAWGNSMELNQVEFPPLPNSRGFLIIYGVFDYLLDLLIFQTFYKMAFCKLLV